jgi:hypothetical protein
VNSSFQFGLGHRTRWIDTPLTHDPFLILKIEDRFKVLPIKKPRRALMICDPCGILLINNTFYLTTAESNWAWNMPQEYQNNVYRLKFGRGQ